MTKIRNAGISRLMALGAEIAHLPLLRPLNLAVRQFHLRAVIPWVEAGLNHKLVSPVVRVIPRHSVLLADRFNFLESDLDVSLVFEGKIPPLDIRRILAAWKEIQKPFPFLGEVELYERLEHERRQQIQSRFRSILEPIRLLRKWRWQARDLATTPLIYHRQKAIRSIRRIQADLGVPADVPVVPTSDHAEALGRAVRETLLRFFPRGKGRRRKIRPTSAYSRYLGWTLCTPKGLSESEFELALPAEDLAVLAALLPDGEAWMSENSRNIRELRLTQPIGDALAAVTVNELLAMRSVKRVSPALGEGNDRENWERDLKRILARAGYPPIAFEI